MHVRLLAELTAFRDVTVLPGNTGVVIAGVTPRFSLCVVRIGAERVVSNLWGGRYSRGIPNLPGAKKL